MARFIRIQNKAVNLDSIAYIEFLESGRAMVFMTGLTQEKQHIPLEPAEARALQAFFEKEYTFAVGSPAPALAQAVPAQVRPVAAPMRF
jgi:hypothetical protein